MIALRQPRGPGRWRRCACSAVAALAWAAPAAAREDPGAAFTLDLAAYRVIPPALLTWRELPPLRDGLVALAAVAVSVDGRFAAATGNEILRGRFDAGAGADRRVRLPASARCLAFAPDGALIVGFDRSYQTFPPDGGEPVDGPTLAEFSSLTSIAASSNHVFAADAGQKMVWVFDRSGRLAGHIRNADGHAFAIPSPHFDVAVAPDGTAWVVHPGELRLENWSADGRRLRMWGRPGSRVDGFCGCCNPVDIALMPDGGFVTAEKGIVRVKVHRPDGTLESVVAGPDDFHEATTSLDLAVDAAGRVIAADAARGALRVFERRAGAAANGASGALR